jgi:hypothetical protein
MGSLKTDADAKPTGIKKEVKDVKAAVEGVKKSTDERLAEVERKMGVLTRNHDTAVECFDTRTRQLLTWAQEITKAAQEDAEASGEASDLKDPEDMLTADEPPPELDAGSPKLARSRTESVAELDKVEPKVDLGTAVEATKKQ